MLSDNLPQSSTHGKVNPVKAQNQFTYKMQEMVGKGTFGTVFEAKCDQTNEIVAIKSVFQDVRYNNRELEILKMLDHPNVIKMDNHFYTSKKMTNTTKDQVYLNVVMKYMPVNLSQYIKGIVKKGQRVPMNNIKLISFQLMKALDYLLMKGICHRDLKPHNILIDKDTLEVRICDFGSAKLLVKDQPNIAYICSRYYRAPELIFGTTQYSNSIDMWSIGCVIAEIATGNPLFHGETSADQLFEIIKLLGTPTKEQINEMNPNYHKYKFPLIRSFTLKEVLNHSQYSEKELIVFIDFLSKILLYEPSKRLTPQEAMNHPFLVELSNKNTEGRTQCRFDERCDINKQFESALISDH